MQPQPPGGYGQGPFNPNMNPNMQQQGQFQHQQFQPGMAPPMPYHMQQQQPMYYPPNYQQARPVHNGHLNMIQNQNIHQPPIWQPEQVSISFPVSAIDSFIRCGFLSTSCYSTTLSYLLCFHRCVISSELLSLPSRLFLFLFCPNKSMITFLEKIIYKNPQHTMFLISA
jgi:hypothetical protein